MKISEARVVCDNVTKCDITSLTSNDVIKLEQAFGVCVDLELTVRAMVSGTSRVSEAVAAEVIKSTDIVKTILALRNNKSVPKEQTLVTVLARIVLGRLQNDGDRYEIDHDKFKIGFRMDVSTKPDYDWEGIKVAAGVSVSSEIVNTELAKCFKAPSLPGNPSGASQAMLEGKLDSKYKRDKSFTDIIIEFNWKGE
jgi:hypothetical protein